MQRLLLLFPLALAGCGFQAAALVPSYDGIEQMPADVQDLDTSDADGLDIDDSDPYIGALGPSDTGSGEVSGATLTIEGTGERLCVIIDPQTVWRDDFQLAPGGTEFENPFYENFPYDDGDLDLLAGLSAFYTGTPGEVMGDFFVDFRDENGIERRVDTNLCLQEDTHGVAGGTAGRASPEGCSFETQVGELYTIAVRVFSSPIDDDELTYAMSIRTGECPATINECTLRGDYDYTEGLEDQLPGGFFTPEHMYCDGLQ